MLVLFFLIELKLNRDPVFLLFSSSTLSFFLMEGNLCSLRHPYGIKSSYEEPYGSPYGDSGSYDPFWCIPCLYPFTLWPFIWGIQVMELEIFKLRVGIKIRPLADSNLLMQVFNG